MSVQVFGVDVGGSGVKGAPVDLSTGALTAERSRIPTPHPSTPAAVTDAIAEIVESHGWTGPIGVTVPGVVRNGVVETAANIDAGWVGLDAGAMLSDRLEMPVTVLNDADAAGLAEARFGAAAGEPGVVILLTFGTGIGSAYVYNGRLIPNTELGHLQFRGQEAEQYAAGRLVKRGDLTVDWWAKRVDEVLRYIEELFWPDLFVFGGGISKRFEDYSHHFSTRAQIVPAVLRNQAGIVGAAYAASIGADHG
ncbi:MAG TPA: ROK family protein [Acidimicrobiia bacterium]|nr:ROK family protein [Acidimicrobiia bacterium]